MVTYEALFAFGESSDKNDYVKNELEKYGFDSMVDYVYYCESISDDLDEDKLFNKLKEEMEKLGFTLEHELGVDKLRSLYSGKLQFSKNQYYKNDKVKKL